jgi:hypothetical protein
MISKNFELVVPFYEVQDPAGNSIYIPLVQAILMTPQNSRFQLSLIFDTGANVTTLRADLYPLLGLASWDVGQRRDTSTAGGPSVAYQYQGTLEVFGKTINCPIHLMQMALHPLVHGLLGRDTVYREFGFGFWECKNELYVTLNPLVSTP